MFILIFCWWWFYVSDDFMFVKILCLQWCFMTILCFRLFLWRLNANDVCMFTIYVYDDFIFMMILFLHMMILYFLMILCLGWFVLLCTMCIIVHLILCKNLPQVQHHSVQLLGSYEAKRTKKFFFRFPDCNKVTNDSVNERANKWTNKRMID